MKFAIITHAPHIVAQNQYFAYAPYVREMNVWAKQVAELIIVAPVSLFKKSEIDVSYTHSNIKFVPIRLTSHRSIQLLDYSLTQLTLLYH